VGKEKPRPQNKNTRKGGHGPDIEETAIKKKKGSLLIRRPFKRGRKKCQEKKRDLPYPGACDFGNSPQDEKKKRDLDRGGGDLLGEDPLQAPGKSREKEKREGGRGMQSRSGGRVSDRRRNTSISQQHRGKKKEKKK